MIETGNAIASIPRIPAISTISLLPTVIHLYLDAWIPRTEVLRYTFLIAHHTTHVTAVVSNNRNMSPQGHCHAVERATRRIDGVSTPKLSHMGNHSPVQIIDHRVWLHFRFPFSFR
jgi:hypothetical protein